ncbi:PepSY domain-containing protein [Shewanella sp. D64]|uniref:PepSY domain-containing protein n=1 Tax=unclassified Shewanella TaxID=196818 RepID=UPI0022BA33B6|nr:MULTISPECIES: PepSY domain-containing protein [unclassified Shewanella]MEC4729074.1 PepSY domain-containing protein [Shewanella sp. D64]MEC4739794.1 PepSY domain-containing protein [Shewanella sp. E94]WBJ94032.1 PepSY domain-containing protein [Shewanella sp. MTB7]
MKLGSILLLTTTLILSSLVSFTGQASSVYLVSTAMSTMAEQSSKQVSRQLKVKSRDHAIQLVRRQYQGKVLKAQSSQVNGHSGYRIKMLSNQGVVFYVSVDAQTGSVRRN